jgi:hypothetical protein
LPESSVFKWARHRASQYRTKFLVGGFLFSGVAAGVSTFVVLPAHATTAEKALAAILAVAVAAALTCIGTYTVALLTAHYEQRNALRVRLSVFDARIAELEAAPVGPAHGDRLRQVAKNLSKWLQVDLEDWVKNSPDITRNAYGENPDTWRKAFREHFPALGIVLGKIEKADTAYATFRRRVRREARLAGMDQWPWVLDQFAYGLARAIRVRAMQDLLKTPFEFDWRE